MRIRLLVFLLLVPVCASAERLPLKAYTVAEGLPNNIINKIVRDSRLSLRRVRQPARAAPAEAARRCDGQTIPW